MLSEVAYLGSDLRLRRLRLFILAAAHRLWPRLDHEACRLAVEAAWRLAEGAATAEEVTEQFDALEPIYEEACATDSWEVARLVRVLTGLLPYPSSAAFELVTPISLWGGGAPVPLLNPTETKDC